MSIVLQFFEFVLKNEERHLLNVALHCRTYGSFPSIPSVLLSSYQHIAIRRGYKKRLCIYTTCFMKEHGHKLFFFFYRGYYQSTFLMGPEMKTQS